MQSNNFLVTGVNPANNEKNVATDSTMTITFSIDMNQATINTANIQFRKVNGSAVPAAVSYNFSRRKATVQPSDPLEPGVQYQIHIVGGTTGITSITGQYLPESKNYEFTTAFSETLSEPKSLSVSVSNGYPTASWTQPDAYSLAQPLSYEVKVSTSNVSPESNPGSVVWPSAIDINTLSSTTLNIPKKLSEGNYYLYVRALNGESVSAWVSAQFAVEAVTTTPTPNPDPTPTVPGAYFEVSETYPKMDAVDITPDNIIVLMTSPVDDTTVTTDSVYIIPKGRTGELTAIDFLTEFSPAKAIPSTTSVANNVITITPSASLENDTEYTIIIRETVGGTGGETLGEPYHWSFLSEFTYLYGDPEGIRDDIGGFIQNISERALYRYMADVSRKAYDIVSGTDDFAESDYEDGKAPYAVHQYVRYYAGYDLLLNAYIQNTSGTGKAIRLGDLQVEGTSKTADVTGLLRSFKDRIKDWEDAIHGHHNRGYAKPITAVKGETGAAYPDFLTRAEFKELGK